MKEYDVNATFYGMEQELNNYKMSIKNHLGFGKELLENNVMEITVSNATKEDYIAELSDEKVAKIEEQENRRPTESAIIRREMAKVVAQKEEEKQYE